MDVQTQSPAMPSSEPEQKKKTPIERLQEFEKASDTIDDSLKNIWQNLASLGATIALIGGVLVGVVNQIESNLPKGIAEQIKTTLGAEPKEKEQAQLKDKEALLAQIGAELDASYVFYWYYQKNDKGQMELNLTDQWIGEGRPFQPLSVYQLTGEGLARFESHTQGGTVVSVRSQMAASDPLRKRMEFRGSEIQYSIPIPVKTGDESRLGTVAVEFDRVNIDQKTRVENALYKYAEKLSDF